MSENNPDIFDVGRTTVPVGETPSPETVEWHYSVGGESLGPVTVPQLQAKLASGEVPRTAFVWKAGMADWLRVSDVMEFAAPIPQDEKPVVSGKDEFDVNRTILAQPPAATPPPQQVQQQTPPQQQNSPDMMPQQRIDGELPVGHVLDNRYMVVRTIGRGGMGMVYEAIDRETQARYAIKMVVPELVSSPEALANLKKEVAAAEQISHQNLLKVNYLAQTASGTYIVMEYVDGEDLEAYRLRKGGKISEAEFRQFAPQILTGLDFLHEHGLVHLDIKPQNILVTKSGEVKVADFGIAKTIKEQLQRSGNTTPGTGTLCFMAPEQLRAKDVCDRRTDVYGMALAFSVLLSGSYPFSTTSREEVIKWHLDPQHKLTTIENKKLRTILEDAIAVDLKVRTGSCKQLLKELARAGLGIVGDGIRPEELPADPARDSAHTKYVESKEVGTDPDRLNGPLPQSPKGVYDELKRVLALSTNTKDDQRRRRIDSLVTSCRELLAGQPDLEPAFCLLLEHASKTQLQKDSAESEKARTQNTYAGYALVAFSAVFFVWTFGTRYTLLSSLSVVAGMAGALHFLSERYPVTKQFSPFAWKQALGKVLLVWTGISLFLLFWGHLKPYSRVEAARYREYRHDVEETWKNDPSMQTYEERNWDNFMAEQYSSAGIVVLLPLGVYLLSSARMKKFANAEKNS